MTTSAPYDDPIATATLPHPDRGYARWLQAPPLFFDANRRLWVAARGDVVRAILLDPRWRTRPQREPVPAALQGGTAGAVFAQLLRMNDDHARHTLPRQVIVQALTSVALTEVERQAQRLAQRLLLEHDGDRTGWTFAVPIAVVASLLGVAPTRLANVIVWVRQFAEGLSPLADRPQIARADSAARALMQEMQRLLADADGPGLAARIQAQARASGWHDDAAVSANLIGLLWQSCEAGAGLIGNAMVALAATARTPEAITRAQLLALVESVSEREPSIQNTRRFAGCAMEVAGCAIEPDDTVLLLLAAATRDDGDGAIGFGHGRHRCPGRDWAVTIAVAALTALCAQAPFPAQALHWHYRPSLNARIPHFTDEPAVQR